MKGSDVLRLVEQMHHDKNIDRELIFDGIEAALQLAAQKHFGEEEEVQVNIDRESGEIKVWKAEEEIDPALLGRIPAQSAKNVMIQKIREAESNAVFDEFSAMKGDLVTGAVQRNESGAAIVSLGKSEAILPKGEQIPGESYHVNDRIKAVILEVRRAGQRVKIILSRKHAELVRRLFEEEIPEIQDRIIEIKAVAREAGYRSKIAVSSIDLKVDCVGACVGVRGSRIKNIVDELGGERIDIVRWNDSLQVMIPNALQPAEIEEVFIYPRPGRAIVLVQEDQLSLAIGRRGQNVRLASKLVGWDIEIMTHEELNESIEKAERCFSAIPGVTDELVEAFIEEGFMSFDDLSFCEPEDMVEIAGVTEEQALEIIDFAEDIAERIERGEDVGIQLEPDESPGEGDEAATDDELSEEEEAPTPTSEGHDWEEVEIAKESAAEETADLPDAESDAAAPIDNGEEAAGEEAETDDDEGEVDRAVSVADDNGDREEVVQTQADAAVAEEHASP